MLFPLMFSDCSTKMWSEHIRNLQARVREPVFLQSNENFVSVQSPKMIKRPLEEMMMIIFKSIDEGFGGGVETSGEEVVLIGISLGLFIVS